MRKEDAQWVMCTNGVRGKPGSQNRDVWPPTERFGQITEGSSVNRTRMPARAPPVYHGAFGRGAVPVASVVRLSMWENAGRRLARGAWITFSAVLLVLLSACKREPIAIAVIPRACGTALWEPEHAGAAAAARARGMSVYWNAPTRTNDVQKQIALLEKVVALGYRGIVLAPDETLALRTPIKRVTRSHKQ